MSQEIRGITVILQFLGQTYLTTSATDSNRTFPAFGDTEARDTPDTPPEWDYKQKS